MNAYIKSCHSCIENSSGPFITHIKNHIPHNCVQYHAGSVRSFSLRPYLIQGGRCSLVHPRWPPHCFEHAVPASGPWCRLSVGLDALSLEFTMAPSSPTGLCAHSILSEAFPNFHILKIVNHPLRFITSHLSCFMLFYHLTHYTLFCLLSSMEVP